jgi:hypothetical protein
VPNVPYGAGVYVDHNLRRTIKAAVVKCCFIVTNRPCAYLTARKFDVLLGFGDVA